MFIFRIFLLIFSIFNASIWKLNYNNFLSTIFIIISIILVGFILIIDVKNIILNIQKNDYTYIKRVQKQERTKSTIVIDFNKTIVFLLLVIIGLIILFNYNNYKLNKIEYEFVDGMNDWLNDTKKKLK